ncbi:MAG: tetratricopeptide repeat protein [Deltaproteobacteria bacterium]|nr:MAG: tetratricopeptide repeat protein [Deltaproteobacteria bacterium]
MNKNSPARVLSLLLAVLMLFLPLRPSWGGMFDSLTIDKEREIGEEFFLELQQVIPVVEDPFIASYFNRLGQKLVSQLEAQPFKYRFFVVNDPSMNAFAVPGGYIFVTTGMIRMMEREGELAGVLAHEISHVYARHMFKTMEKAKVANVASILGALASIALAGVGGAALAQALMATSMAGGTSAMLAYSRDFEKEADALGFKWMVKAGYDPRDMMSIFKKMNRQRWFEGGKIPIYLSTHPDIDGRLVDLGHQLSQYGQPRPSAGNNPEFQYFAIRVEATSGNAHQLLRRMTQDSLREPQDPAFHYGKALALANLERGDEALAEFQQALKLTPGNYLIQRDLAIYYFQRNRYMDASKILEDLSRQHPQDEAVLYYLGRICQERRQYDQALALFEKVHKLNPAFIEVYYNLGTVYGEKKQLGPAHYYLAFHSLKTKALPVALFHFRKALSNLNSSDPRYPEVKRQIARLEKMKVRVRN